MQKLAGLWLTWTPNSRKQMGSFETRNVIDRFKSWNDDLIKDELQKNAFPYAALMEHWQGDFNIGTLIRNANAFNASRVFYIGKKKWDRRGAVGTHNYTGLSYLTDYSELEQLKQKYVFIGVDNVPGSIDIETFQWPENPLMIFGEEGTGLTEEMKKHCEKMVYITQYGSVRSLNAACASAVAFYDYVRKHSK
jgi:tRNA G18 (ribose-2'-O)-methylase SpoU